jgi:hypothetical protein
VAARQPGTLPVPGNQFSRIYHGRPELIDHILATTELARGNLTIEIDATHVTSIGDQPSLRKNATWPDHAPVIATIS